MTRAATDQAWSEVLQCHWRGWRVVGRRALALDLPPENCPNMVGAIRTAQALMPSVREIRTFCDGAADTRYCCTAGRWRAFRPHKRSTGDDE